jgi:hypothetical protein
MSFIRRKPLVSATPKLTLVGCIAAATDAANARMRAFGRTEWDARDERLAFDILCRGMRRLPAPYREMADRMEHARHA